MTAARRRLPTTGVRPGPASGAVLIRFWRGFRAVERPLREVGFEPEGELPLSPPGSSPAAGSLSEESRGPRVLGLVPFGPRDRGQAPVEVRDEGPPDDGLPVPVPGGAGPGLRAVQAHQDERCGLERLPVRVVGHAEGAAALVLGLGRPEPNGAHRRVDAGQSRVLRVALGDGLVDAGLDDQADEFG